MNTYNMDKMYESFAGSMEIMQRWLDESEQENKQLKDKIDKAIKYINKFEDIKAYYNYEENGYEEYNYEEDFKIDLLKILKEVE